MGSNGVGGMVHDLFLIVKISRVVETRLDKQRQGGAACFRLVDSRNSVVISPLISEIDLCIVALRAITVVTVQATRTDEYLLISNSA